MSLEESHKNRADDQCELYKAESDLKIYEVPTKSDTREEDCLLICAKCLAQLDKKRGVRQ